MKNSTKFFFGMFTVVFLLIVFSSITFAGYFSNDDYKKWAKEAVKQEKSFKPTKGALAVLYFNNQSGKKDYNSLQNLLPLMLTYDYKKIKRKNFQVIERGKLQALMDELQLGASGLVKPETAPRVGKLLGAESILSGNLLSDKKAELKVKPEIQNVMKQKTLEQKDVSGQINDIVQIEKNILYNSLKSLQIKVTEKERKDLDKPLSKEPGALIPLSDGFRKIDGGDWEGAKPLITDAFKKDPGLITFIAEFVKDIALPGVSAVAVGKFIYELKKMKKDKGEKKSPVMSVPMPKGFSTPKFP